MQLKFSNWFGHDFSYHIGSRTILNDYLACILRPANEMVSNINMFQPPLIDWVLGQGDRTLVVLKNRNRYAYLTNVLYHLSEVHTFLDCCCQSTVGCFLDFQEIRGPALFKLKQYRLILSLSSVDDAQSASL